MVLQTEGKYGSYYDIFLFFFKDLKGSAMLTSKKAWKTRNVLLVIQKLCQHWLWSVGIW